MSDDTAQTYIAHQEGRKDNVVTGEYSYVDPYGALITVNYIADENGYREERKSQADFVQIRAIPVVQAAPVPKPAPVVRKVVKPAPARKVVKAVEPIVKQVVKAETGSDDSDLVARIISQLTPFIKTTVADSLGSQQQTRTTSRVVAVQQPVVQAVRAVPVVTEVSSTSSLFGADGENRITVDSPNYSFDKILF